MQESVNQARLNRNRSAAKNINDEPVTCITCLENAREVLLSPCGHVCLCSDCVLQVAICPVCREPIRAIIPAFIC